MVACNVTHTWERQLLRLQTNMTLFFLVTGSAENCRACRYSTAGPADSADTHRRRKSRLFLVLCTPGGGTYTKRDTGEPLICWSEPKNKKSQYVRRYSSQQSCHFSRNSALRRPADARFRRQQTKVVVQLEIKLNKEIDPATKSKIRWYAQRVIDQKTLYWFVAAFSQSAVSQSASRTNRVRWFIR